MGAELNQCPLPRKGECIKSAPDRLLTNDLTATMPKGPLRNKKLLRSSEAEDQNPGKRIVRIRVRVSSRALSGASGPTQ